MASRRRTSTFARRTNKRPRDAGARRPGDREEEAEQEDDETPGRFRLRSSQLALTYPHCDMEKEDVQAFLKSLLQDQYVGSVICRELHMDGSKHIHCFIQLKEKSNYNDPHALDLTSPGGSIFHGNYQGAISPKAFAVYVIEDGDYIVDNVDLSTLPGRVKISDAVWRMLRRGATDQEISTIFPGFLLMNLSRVTAARRTISVWRQRDAQHQRSTNWRIQVNLSPTALEAKVMNWLTLNLWTSTPRPERQVQLYMRSETGCGKSTLVNNLRLTGLRIFNFPYERAWVEGYEDGKYDMVVFDEFNGQVPITFMNSFLDGFPVYIPQRHGGVTKYDNLPCIINANNSPRDFYPDATLAQLNAFHARLLIVDFGSANINVISRNRIIM